MKKILISIAFFLFLLFLLGFYFYWGKYSQIIFPRSWESVRSKVLGECELIDVNNQESVERATLMLKSVSSKFAKDESEKISLLLVYDPETGIDNMKCRIGWLGNPESGKVLIFYKNKNNEVTRLLIKSK